MVSMETTFKLIYATATVTNLIHPSLVDLQCVEEMIAESGKVAPHESNTPPIIRN